MSNLFIALSETDKRVIFVICLLFIITLLILGYIGLIITRVMKWQGKRADQFTHDVLVTRVVTTKSHFMSYARKKNFVWFFRQSWIPLSIVFAATLLVIIHHSVTGNWSYDFWDYKKTGFFTICYLWDFENPEYYTQVFGITLLKQWPGLINSPHWEAEAWLSYIFIPLIFIGCGWYFVSVQSCIARTIRIYALRDKIFSKNLDNFNINTTVTRFSGPENDNEKK